MHEVRKVGSISSISRKEQQQKNERKKHILNYVCVACLNTWRSCALHSRFFSPDLLPFSSSLFSFSLSPKFRQLLLLSVECVGCCLYYPFRWLISSSFLSNKLQHTKWQTPLRECIVSII